MSGPPEDRDAAIDVLVAAVAVGVDHICACDDYGPHHTNRIMRKALSAYAADLAIVTKIGARHPNSAR